MHASLDRHRISVLRISIWIGWLLLNLRLDWLAAAQPYLDELSRTCDFACQQGILQRSLSLRTPALCRLPRCLREFLRGNMLN